MSGKGRQYRVECHHLVKTWWKIQERANDQDSWRDTFAAPFNGPSARRDAEIYCRVLQSKYDEVAA